jgi:hypothetical protein
MIEMKLLNRVMWLNMEQYISFAICGTETSVVLFIRPHKIAGKLTSLCRLTYSYLEIMQADSDLNC